jgi:hypothetical protein
MDTFAVGDRVRTLPPFEIVGDLEVFKVSEDGTMCAVDYVGTDPEKTDFNFYVRHLEKV